MTNGQTSSPSTPSRTPWAIVAVAAIVLTLGIVAAVQNARSLEALSGGPAPSGLVTYVITGTAQRASLTYTDALGSILQQGSVTLPHTQHIGVVPFGTFLSASAQNADDTGCVRVTIRADGSDLKSGESCGAYVVASVTATR